MKFIDMTGQRYSRLVAISQNGRDKHGKTRWFCKCDCGGSVTTVTERLRSGNTKSCGCLDREITAARNYRHGHAIRGSHSSEYSTWRGMINRCTNSKAEGFANYGGRGITVSKEWRTFENFYRDMGPKPSPVHTLDRIDVNGNYQKGAVRWATPDQQAKNKRPPSEWRPRKLNSRDTATGRFITRKLAA